MNGVEILNQTNVYQQDGCGWLCFCIVGIAFISGLIMAIKSFIDFGFDIDVIMIPIGMLVVGVFIGIICFGLTLHDTDELNYIEYQVTVSDEVKFSDFMDKYKIIDQEGKIYTVKDRQEEK